MRWRPIAALIAVSVLAMPAGAQVHRCKDASGKFTYSDRACDTTHSGGVIELKKSRESILEERLQAAEANERKYRAQDAERQQRAFEQQQAQPRAVANQPAPRNLAESRECKDAQKDLEIVSTIMTLSQNDKRMRTNAAITKVNASCGSNTALMQEPPKIIVHPTIITHCDPGFCYDNQGGVFHKAGPDFMTGPNGRTCHRAGSMWNCN